MKPCSSAKFSESLSHEEEKNVNKSLYCLFDYIVISTVFLLVATVLKAVTV